MLSRLARHKPLANKLQSRCSKFLFSAQTDREQPFFDAAQIQQLQQTNVNLKKKNNNNPPIIEPQFFHKDQFVIESDKYAIDCSKYDSNDISPNNRQLCEEMRDKFAETGLVYLKNTNLSDLQQMRALATVLIPSEMTMSYKGGSNWRNYIEPNVYDTGAPKEAFIHYHHEMAYVRYSPQSLAFCAKHALPQQRGSSFVSDQIQATNELLKTDFGQKLKEKRICYIRCLTDENHYKNIAQKSEFSVYNHWQKSFGSQNIEEATQTAKESGLSIEWDMTHPLHGRYMKTKFATDVFEYCPSLDRNVLFASVADHWMWFDTWPGLSELPNEDRPLCITYGDGEHIDYDDLRTFVDIYDKYGIRLDWSVGDVAVMCNYRWAHGRPLYHLENDTEQRELGVVLGQAFERQGQRDDKW